MTRKDFLNNSIEVEMAVSFTNAWKDSLKDGLVVALRSSFSPSVPVYFAKKTEMRGSQFISVKGDFQIL